tara:strand:+ start:3323 stop:3751 length:429 start_codon:yes stop_codon:yes gene_type:complete
MINNIIDLITIINKTPKKKFVFPSGKINLFEMTNNEKIEYLKKNPNAMFSYGRDSFRNSVFTNFSFDKDDKKMFYDIIRLKPFSDVSGWKGDELVKVEGTDRHSGLNINDNWNPTNWYDIDFLTSSSRIFLNWSKEPWEDLK